MENESLRDCLRRNFKGSDARPARGGGAKDEFDALLHKAIATDRELASQMLTWGSNPPPCLLDYARIVLRDGHPAPGSALVRIGSREHAAMQKRIAARPTIWTELADVVADYIKQFDALEPILKLANLVSELDERAKRTQDIEEYEKISDAVSEGMESLRPHRELLVNFMQISKSLAALCVQAADLEEQEQEFVCQAWDDVVGLGVDVTLVEHELGILSGDEND